MNINLQYSIKTKSHKTVKRLDRWYGEGGGRGSRMGNTCIPVADSFLYLAKLIQLYKV